MMLLAGRLVLISLQKVSYHACTRRRENDNPALHELNKVLNRLLYFKYSGFSP